jgi:excisionase family DNA binding protein
MYPLAHILLSVKIRKIETNGENSMTLTQRDDVLTTGEAIEYLKISKPTFLRYVHLGRIKATKAGRGWRVLQSELYRFLKGEMDKGGLDDDRDEREQDSFGGGI